MAQDGAGGDQGGVNGAAAAAAAAVRHQRHLTAVARACQIGGAAAHLCVATALGIRQLRTVWRSTMWCGVLRRLGMTTASPALAPPPAPLLPAYLQAADGEGLRRPRHQHHPAAGPHGAALQLAAQDHRAWRGAEGGFASFGA